MTVEQDETSSEQLCGTEWKKIKKKEKEKVGVPIEIHDVHPYGTRSVLYSLGPNCDVLCALSLREMWTLWLALLALLHGAGHTNLYVCFSYQA